MESWHTGLEFLDDWTYIDEPEPKLGRLRMLRTEEKITSPNSDLHARVQMLKLFPSRPLDILSYSEERNGLFITG